MRCLKCQKLLNSPCLYGLHRACFLNWFSLKEDGRSVSFTDLDLKKSASYSDSHPSITKSKDSFYHGKYRKYSARLGSTQYIIKLQESKYPDLPATEYICNQIASLLGIKVPEYYLIRYTEEIPDQPKTSKTNILSDQNKEATSSYMAFVTKNFMQNKTGTLNHIYKYLPKGDKNYNCFNIIQVIKQQTACLSDIESFIKICLFDTFIGNGDRHGRNLGIVDTTGTKRLAPMYDNPSFIGTEVLLGADFNPSGCIWTSHSKEPILKDYIKEFKKLGFQKVCFLFVNKVIVRFQHIINKVNDSEISEKRKQAFIKFLTKQLNSVKLSLKEDF